MKSRALFLDHVGALGGAELALIDVARAYRDTSTFLLFSDGPFRQRLAASGVQVEVFEGGQALHAIRRETRWPGLRAVVEVVSLAWKVARLAKRYDFLHANSQKAFVVACLAGLVSRRPVIWDLNDLLLPTHFSRLNIRLDVFLANRLAALVIANSQASADALIAQGGPRDRVRVVYNGIDPAPFDAIGDDAIAAVRREIGLGDGPVLGLFGRLAAWKGQHVALEALARLPDDVQLVLVGDALFGEDEYAARLRARCAALGLDGRVHFLGFRADVPLLMRAVDIVLHTSTAPEPFGRVVVEGMLARKPVIATRAGGVEEILTEGVTGLMTPPGDAAALAEAVRGLIDDPDGAARMAAAGRADAASRFTVDAMIAAMSVHMEAVGR